jgi:hypothetical protein
MINSDFTDSLVRVLISNTNNNIDNNISKKTMINENSNSHNESSSKTDGYFKYNNKNNIQKSSNNDNSNSPTRDRASSNGIKTDHINGSTTSSLLKPAKKRGVSYISFFHSVNSIEDLTSAASSLITLEEGIYRDKENHRDDNDDNLIIEETMCICIALANAATYSKKCALRMFNGDLMSVMLRLAASPNLEIVRQALKCIGASFCPLQSKMLPSMTAGGINNNNSEAIRRKSLQAQIYSEALAVLTAALSSPSSLGIHFLVVLIPFVNIYFSFLLCLFGWSVWKRMEIRLCNTSCCNLFK